MQGRKIGQHGFRAPLVWGVLFVGWALSGGAPSSPAQQPREPRVARLIRQLGSEKYAERHRADVELAELGAGSREQLTAALSHQDAEVRLRAADLLRRLEVAELWQAAPVQYRCQQQPVGDVLEQLNDQTGNHVLVGEGFGNFRPAKVSLDLPAGTFWEAIDQLCRQSENHIRPHYNPHQPGLVLVAGAPGDHPVTYCGPVRAQVTSARRVFIEQFDYENLASDVTHTFQLNLEILWEDRFRLVAYRSQPELVEAVTDTGRPLPSAQPGSSGWNVAGSGTRQLTASLRLHPPPTSAKELSTLKLRWGLIAVGDMATLEIDDLEPRKPHHSDDVVAVIESLDERPGNRWVASVLVARDLVCPDPQEVLLEENKLELFDIEGRAFRASLQSKVLTDEGARIKITFQAPMSDAKPHRLRLTYPRIRTQRDLEIVFQNVPLPIAKPDE